MTEIENCPFCGSNALEIWHRLNGTQSVTCEECDTIGPRADLGSKAITAWNTRTDDKHLGQLKNLLAIIHRDGGHYVAEHGLEKATEDAINKVANLIHERQVDIVLLKRAYSLGYDSGRANNNSLSHCWERDKDFFDCIPSDGWISVGDRLPESIGSYLIHHKDKQLDMIAWAFYTSKNKWAGNNEFYKNVTHWMPLPDPPDTGKEQNGYNKHKT